MKRILILFVIILFFVYNSCKTTKSVTSSENYSTKDSIISQAVKDTVCEGLRYHLKKYWSYDKNTRLYRYNQNDLSNYMHCFTNKNEAIILLGQPSQMYNGYMFYYTNCHCFEEFRDSCYKQCNCYTLSTKKCSYWKLKFGDNGKISKIIYETVNFIE